MLKFAKGQGDGDISNIARLKKNLNEEDKAILEMNLLNRVFEKSLIENKTLNLSVFDSKVFLNELSKVSGSFESKEAKEFLELTQGFNKLFNQDAEIAKAFKQSLTQKEGANLATSLQGKAQMAIVKALWENVIRLMGKVPFATAWNEKVQGAALRYHISHALKRAVSVDDFKNTLQNSLKQGKFNNKTKEIIKEFNESFESIKKENEALLKQSDEELVNKSIDIFQNNDKNNAYNALYYGANKKDYQKALKESERLKKEKQKQNLATKQEQELESDKLFEEAMKTKQVPSGVQPKNMENKRDFIIETEILKSRDDFVKLLENGDFIFKDKKGKKHILDTATQEQWLKTFDLTNLSDEFTPQLKDELKAVIQKDIKVQVGSLYKLVSQGKEEFIPQIRQVLEEPELALKDSETSLLLVKHIKNNDYFVNVSIDKNEAFISISNGIKEFNNLKNKIKAGAKVVYQSPNANSNLQTLLQDSLYSSNKIDKDIITNKETKSQAPQNFTYDTETLKKYLEADAKYSFSNLDEALKTKATIEEYKEYIKNAPDDFLKQQGFKIDKNEIIQRINEHLDDNLIGLNAKIKKLKEYNKFRESLKNQPELNEIQKLMDDYQAINGFNFGDRIYTINKNPTLKELIYKAQGFKTASGKKVTLNELLKTGEAGEEAAWVIGGIVLGDQLFYYTLKNFMRSKEWATKNINDLSESEMKEKLGDMIMLKCLEKQKQGGLSQELALKEAKEELRREYETFMKERKLTEFVEAKNATTNSANSAENQVKAFEFTTPKETSAYLLRKTLRDDLKPYVENHTPIINKTDGRVAFITQKGLGKLSSSKASEKSIQNGFSEAQHFEVVKNLKELYENAKFSDTMADKNGAKNLQIHHYTADFILDGESAQAKIMLKETIDEQNKGNRIYTLELESVARLKPAEPQAPATASVKPQNSTTSPAVSTHSTNA